MAMARHATERHRYEPAPAAPRHARHFVDEVLARWGCDRARESAVLLTSEVVADAVGHAPTRIDLNILLRGDRVRVEVSDDPGLTKARRGALERRTARRLLRRLSERWGSDLDRDRTTTWFELPAA